MFGKLFISDKKRSWVVRYGIAAATVSLALIITTFLAPLYTRVPFALFYVAVVVSTLYGGRWAGLLATAVSALLGAYFFMPPIYTFAIELEGVLLVSTFFFVSLVVSWLTEKVKRAEVTARLSSAQLMETLDKLRFQAHLLDVVEQAVIATDFDGHVVYWNQFAEKLYGWKAEEVIGQDIVKVVGTDVSREQAVMIMSQLRAGESWSGEFLAKHRDGTTIPVRVHDSPVYDDNGKQIGMVGSSEDISRRIRADREKARLTLAIEEQRLRLDNIVASVPGVVWEAAGEPDAGSQSIDFVSEYVETLLGYSVEEWLSSPNFWLHIVHEEDKERAAREASANFVRGNGTSQFRWIAKDGRVLWVEAQSVAIYDDSGRPIGMRGVTMDITERKLVEERQAELLAREKAARTQAELANRTKDEFLATLSHELRTPLTAMLGWTWMLRYRTLDDETFQRAVETINRNVHVQAHLIDDLLDVSRIITGNLRLEVRPVDLVAVVESAIDIVRPAAIAKGIKLEMEFDRSVNDVVCDPARMQQVAWNLLSNAVKFTPKCGVVRICLKRLEEQIEFSVSDTGRGISAGFLPFVFDRFRQADGSTTRTHGGLGLGLAIVRHLVELHGGTVSVDSEGTDKGSHFVVTLPLIAVSGEQ